MTSSDILAITIIGIPATLIIWFVIYTLANFFKLIIQFSTKYFTSLKGVHLHAKKLGYLFAISFISYHTYFAIYPDDSFYLSEFSLVTKMEAPLESRVLFKDATYPDFHGDYCSYSRISINKSSYVKLLGKIKKDASFSLLRSNSGYTSKPSSRFDFKVPPPPLKVIQSFGRNDTESDEHYFINFLEQNKLEINVCVT